jgi:hypothetical protein
MRSEPGAVATGSVRGAHASIKLHPRLYALARSAGLIGRLDPPRSVTGGIDPDSQNFDRALKTRGASGTGVPRSDRPSGISLFEEFPGRTLTIGAGGGFFTEAVSLSARWLIRAFMLAVAPARFAGAKRRHAIARTVRSG